MKEQLTTNLNSQDSSWPFWPLVPIYPYGKRRTIRQEIVKDTIWTFEQLQGIFYVVVPIRMTVVRLDQGGLLVYAPVAPTKECLRLLQELIVEHGQVKYIILPTISGIEHKVFVPSFARYFAEAQIWIAPHQWSFPVNLPLSWLGFPRQRTSILPTDSKQTPFAQEFDYQILGPIDLKLGYFAEVAFFHKRSRTLLVTDSIVSIPENPPEILNLDPYPLLFHAKDRASDLVADNLDNRRKGWQRICLFALYFQPNVLEIPNWGDVFRHALHASDRSQRAYFGLYPFQWREDWQKSFHALRGNGRLLVAPILQTLILNRAPQETIDWANKIASWNLQRIIPCHFESEIITSGEEFRQAFAFLEQHSASSKENHNNYPLPAIDFKVLQEIDASLCQFGIVPSPKDKV